MGLHLLRNGNIALKRLLSLIIVIVSMPFLPLPSHAQQEEKTYTITLQKTADIKQEIRTLGDKKVLAEPHKIKEGEHIWQILREKGLLKTANLATLLSTLKQLNKSLNNLDLIHPGQKILIPLKIVPLRKSSTPQAKTPQVKTTIVELHGMKLENYTVQPGDSVIKVVMGKYNIPPARLYTEYLDLVRKLNPNINDLNKIYPGQKIRLPIYSPKVITKRIKKKIGQKQPLSKGNKLPNPHLADIKNLFMEIGEEWRDTGEHFIPLRSGGQIDLKASSFPLISFFSGRRVILDSYDKLPQKVCRLIEESWPNYKIVHIEKNESLKTILDKIIPLAGYVRVLGKGEPLNLDGPIPVSVAGDWVLVRAKRPLKDSFRIVVLVLKPDRSSSPISPGIKMFLENMGVKLVIYPQKSSQIESSSIRVDEISGGKGGKGLVRALLTTTGHKFREDLRIPVVGNKKGDFNLVIKADFFLKAKDRDSIIDITGLEKEVLSFLSEHGFRVLQLAGKRDPQDIVGDILGFLGVPYDKGLHALSATEGQGLPMIQIKLEGLVFADAEKKPVFVTPIPLSQELKQFLSQKGFRVFSLITP